ncbi:hypothetical protein IHE45_10G043400 [Dioscorea alata]|uniref:Uncharacterized protein n=1 Tax=Dioscorea alata TaxID=55571 RepID=A0ACB7VAL2_DIOAL|nr:hypothetical protein IHE45_10G043400 [Dioscorea alata]
MVELPQISEALEIKSKEFSFVPLLQRLFYSFSKNHGGRDRLRAALPRLRGSEMIFTGSFLENQQLRVRSSPSCLCSNVYFTSFLFVLQESRWSRSSPGCAAEVTRQ